MKTPLPLQIQLTHLAKVNGGFVASPTERNTAFDALSARFPGQTVTLDARLVAKPTIESESISGGFTLNQTHGTFHGEVAHGGIPQLWTSFDK